ncbi:hypothetical protein L3Q82_019130, partial [Scortum barcoo]
HKNKTRFDRHVTASDLEAGVTGHYIGTCYFHVGTYLWRKTVSLYKSQYHAGPGTHAHPTVEEEDSSNEEDDVLIPVYLSPLVPTVCDNPVQLDLPLTNVQDTQQHIEPPGIRPVESPVNAQNVDSTPDIDNPPDIGDPPNMSNSTSDGPLMFLESNFHQTEPALIKNDLPEDDHPDIRGEQLPVPSKMSDSDVEKDALFHCGVDFSQILEKPEEWTAGCRQDCDSTFGK